MKKYGLIGYPLSHSFSPRYFSNKFSQEGIKHAEYKAYPLEDICEIHALISDNNISGLNVTIPHKESVIPYLDTLSQEAQEVGAVNTILNTGTQLIGHNTDVIGFRQSLQNFVGDALIDKALILGSGGAAKAVAYVLSSCDISYKVVSRTKGDITYTDLDEQHVEEYKLIINTTPLGMHPNENSCPMIPYYSLSDKHFLYDLVYNPEKTLFLMNGEKYGSRTCNGLEMLHLQAEASWNIWNNKKI